MVEFALECLTRNAAVSDFTGFHVQWGILKLQTPSDYVSSLMTMSTMRLNKQVDRVDTPELISVGLLCERLLL